MTADFVDVIGFLAAFTTVSAFYCREMVPLRISAILANFLFIIYGASLGLKPVLALHCMLLPLNFWRLRVSLMVQPPPVVQDRSRAEPQPVTPDPVLRPLPEPRLAERA